MRIALRFLIPGLLPVALLEAQAPGPREVPAPVAPGSPLVLQVERAGELRFVVAELE